MVLDKYRKQLIEQRSALEVNEDQLKSWHNNNVTKALKIDMEIAYLNTVELISVDDRQPVVIAATEVMVDRITNYVPGVE